MKKRCEKRLGSDERFVCTRHENGFHIAGVGDIAYVYKWPIYIIPFEDLGIEGKPVTQYRYEDLK